MTDRMCYYIAYRVIGDDRRYWKKRGTPQAVGEEVSMLLQRGCNDISIRRGKLGLGDKK